MPSDRAFTMAIPGHTIRIEDRDATCCDSHTAHWVVCSCGWEHNAGLTFQANTASAIRAHRLTVIEEAVAHAE